MLTIYIGQGYKYREHSYNFPEITHLNIILKQNTIGLEEENVRLHYNYLIYLFIQTHLI